VVEKELEGGVEGKREDELKKEMGLWQRRNFGRVAWPLVTGVAALMGGLVKD
jgi:hypothetical protein